MQRLMSVGQSTLPAIQMSKQQNGRTYAMNFKAGEVDQYVRGGPLPKSATSRQPMTQEDAMMQMIKQRQEEQKKVKRKQKWMTALQVAGVISGIALAVFFIYQGT